MSLTSPIKQAGESRTLSLDLNNWKRWEERDLEKNQQIDQEKEDVEPATIETQFFPK